MNDIHIFIALVVISKQKGPFEILYDFFFSSYSIMSKFINYYLLGQYFCFSQFRFLLLSFIHFHMILSTEKCLTEPKNIYSFHFYQNHHVFFSSCSFYSFPHIMIIITTFLHFQSNAFVLNSRSFTSNLSWISKISICTINEIWWISVGEGF